MPWLQQATTDATIGELDSAFVTALGLRGVAADVARGLRGAGLQPPPGAGIEVVARTLGLRPNHPAGEDSLERWPSQPATRAEAAYSAWRVLTFNGWERDNARATLAHLSIPAVPEAVAAPLRLAVSHLGAPYVWGGTSADDGGFDCSGLVVDAEGGVDRVGGRTTEEMAASIPAGGRIRLGGRPGRRPRLLRPARPKDAAAAGRPRRPRARRRLVRPRLGARRDARPARQLVLPRELRLRAAAGVAARSSRGGGR